MMAKSASEVVYLTVKDRVGLPEGDGNAPPEDRDNIRLDRDGEFTIKDGQLTVRDGV